MLQMRENPESKSASGFFDSSRFTGNIIMDMLQKAAIVVSFALALAITIVFVAVLSNDSRAAALSQPAEMGLCPEDQA